MVSWGTSPSQVVAIDDHIPDPATLDDPDARAAAERALAYMDLAPGTPIAGQRLDRVFIGSCTTAGSRICASPPKSSAAAVSRRTSARWSCRDRGWSRSE